ncbi:hypothetical protein NDU88_004252 [Pleurodeles waltl]|uniref:Uncharacterized protein n=1 Tax=Pleurodeles waltl TaxID=8319 RepID=A0AAV7NIV1_PLEWA|nr:hypothetical protein NDU88_004252 [Pleurodeles waltl]
MHRRGRDRHFLYDSSLISSPSIGEDLHCICYCDLCLEPTMARVTRERAPAFTSEELERLVDGVLPQYRLLYGSPDQQVEHKVEDHRKDLQFGFHGSVVLPCVSNGESFLFCDVFPPGF